MPNDNQNKILAPLAGIRVLDFTHVLAGPFCTRLLADLGGDVVRVESSKHPDHPWQSSFVSEDGRHASYLNTNRSKRSIAIDLKNPAGQEVAARLAAAADVVIENFSASVMDRLNLGFEALSRKNPRLIYVSMSGYGHDGPRRDWTSMNMNLQGYSGLMTVSGAEGDPPTAISNSWNDYVGGLHACFAILQALDERRTSAKGRRIDLSQFECSAVNGRVPPRRGNRSDRAAPQGVYPCSGRDEWCALSVETNDQWISLAKLVCQEDWIDDRRFKNLHGRIANHDEIDQAISAWTVRYSSAEAESRLKAAGISAAQVRRIDQVLDSPDGATVFSPMHERRVGSMCITALPFSLSLSFVDLPQRRSAPSLGEHSAEVLREWIDCSENELRSLEQGEVLR